MESVSPAGFRKALKWSLLVLAFTPLIIGPTTLFPYVFGKTVFIRLATTVFSVILSFFFFKFREEALRSINWNRLKNPVFLSFVFFAALSLLSVFFAVDPQIAFWGDLARGEGFLILLYLLLFLAGSILFFEKEDWLTFFKLSLFSGGAIALDTLINFAQNPEVRPMGFFIGNPSFISAYVLFVIFSALVVMSAGRNNKFWRRASVLSILLAAAALVAVNTRGIFAGILVAILAIALHLALSRKSLVVTFLGRSFPARKIGRWILAGAIFFALLFVGTRFSPVWQTIPGLDRLAQISVDDITVQTRLINLGVGLSAVNPNDVGIGKTLLGWGPDNFSQAYDKFYNPAVQKIERNESIWVDKAHNKLMDVLVMNGVLGLLAYLTLWLYVFKFVFGGRRETSDGDFSRVPLIFFSTSYFVQNLFLFDQITTYIPLFAFFGYVIHTHSSDAPHPRPLPKLCIPASVVISAVLIALFVWAAVIPFYQSSLYVLHLQTKEFSFTPENVNRMLYPHNYAQAELRSDMLLKLSPQSASADVREIIWQVLAVEEKSPSFARAVAFNAQASAYASLANFSGDKRIELLMKAEDVLRKTMKLAPGRQIVMYTLAENYITQGRFNEAVTLADEMLAVEPDSLQAKLLWLGVVVPCDYNDEHKSLERMENLFSDEGEILSASTASFLRTGRDIYIQGAFFKRDSDKFLEGLEQAVRLDKLMVEINTQQVADGVTTNTIVAEDGGLQKLIDAFKIDGWSAVRVVE